MLFPRERFMGLLDSLPVEPTDVLIVPTGGGLCRAALALGLYQEKCAPRIVVSGGLDKPPFSLPAGKIREFLYAAEVPRNAVIIEEHSMNTREQAVEVIGMAVEQNWRSAALIASHYHQYRCFLTFLKAIQEFNCKLRLTSVISSAEFYDPEILDTELEKIGAYNEHVASYEDGIRYLLQLHRPAGRYH